MSTDIDAIRRCLIFGPIKQVQHHLLADRPHFQRMATGLINGLNTKVWNGCQYVYKLSVPVSIATVQLVADRFDAFGKLPVFKGRTIA